jgi:hypothetical protein
VTVILIRFGEAFLGLFACMCAVAVVIIAVAGGIWAVEHAAFRLRVARMHRQVTRHLARSVPDGDRRHVAE